MNANLPEISRPSEEGRSWRAFHFFYHGPLALVLLHFVRPAIGRLLADGLIDSFFFIRYPLGGPHVRLRILPNTNRAEEASERLLVDAAGFLAQRPSISPIDPEAIRRQNLAILATAPEENDDAAYPDNTFMAVPFIPEKERYGGVPLLASSLDFFAISSARSLSFVAAHEDDPWPRQLSAISRLLALQAWGLAHDAEDLMILLASRAGFTAAEDPLLRRGDEAFDRQSDTYCALLRRELASVLGGGEAPWFGEAARRLAHELRGADALLRRSIGLSQIHMTANRLGLKIQEEVYLGRILWRAARELAAADPGFWRELCDTLRPGKNGGRVRNLFPAAFQEAFPGSLRNVLAREEQGLAAELS
ncbi:MAG TPA: lantibiotic dehydratase C-terminal domain-containing protein [Thermoanaerobaculia bacterium]|jgi:hypothetical protein|nr:lantibiotic dehydratase C-terminal domain-containing protein [Thermoanaerobaculia bacterium]